MAQIQTKPLGARTVDIDVELWHVGLITGEEPRQLRLLARFREELLRGRFQL